MYKIKEVVSYQVAGETFDNEQAAKDYVAFKVYEERLINLKKQVTECHTLNPYMRVSSHDVEKEQLQIALKILRELEALYVELYGSSVC